MADHQQTERIVEGQSTGIVLLVFFIMLALIGMAGYFALKQITPADFNVSLPAISVDSVSHSISDFSQSVVQQAEEKLTQVSSQQTAPGVSISRLTFNIVGGTLEIYGQNQGLLFKLAAPTDGISWLGIIKDPYQPLMTVSGYPFFDEKLYGLKRGDNVSALLDANGNIRKFWEEGLSYFSFFSEEPTSIGFIYATPRVLEFNSIMRLYFIDLERGLAAEIVTTEMAFPRWIRTGSFPPAYSTDKYLMLSKKYPGLGNSVIDQVKSFVDAEYQEDSQLRQQLYQEEFKSALLSRNDLSILAKREFEIDRNMVTEYIQPIQRLVRLFYYGKKLGKVNALEELQKKLHPTLQRAIATHVELSLIERQDG